MMPYITYVRDNIRQVTKIRHLACDIMLECNLELFS